MRCPSTVRAVALRTPSARAVQPLDRGNTATTSSEEDRMDVTNIMDVDPSSAPILDIKTVISTGEYKRLAGKHDI